MNNLREAASMVIDLYLTDQDSKSYADLKDEELKSNRIGSRKMAYDDGEPKPKKDNKDKTRKGLVSRRMAYDDK